MSTTDIETIKTIDNDNQVVNFDDIDFMDMDIDIVHRIKFLENLYQENPNLCMERINKIVAIYMFSKVALLEEYLYEIVMNSSLPIELKAEAAKALVHHGSDETDERSYKCLNYVCNVGLKSTSIYSEFIILLMLGGLYVEESKTYFDKILNNQRLNCVFRYKTLISLEKIEDKGYINHGMLTMISNKANDIYYRILACQYMMSNKYSYEDVSKHLKDIALDEDTDYNRRADAADILINFGTEEMKTIGCDIIKELAGNNGNAIFDNRQNVHLVEIEQAVEDGIAYILDLEVKSFEMKDIIEEIVKLSENSKDVNLAINRIMLDKGLYSTRQISLATLFKRIWGVCVKNEELKKRLVEEMVDMAYTCSTGYLARLVNVLSGFEGLNMTISWKQQIVSNFNGRINKYFRDLLDGTSIFNNDEFFRKHVTNIEISIMNKITDIYIDDEELTYYEYFVEKVMNEMACDSNYYADKIFYNIFFGYCSAQIRDEMYNEFREYIDDESFDYYFRCALSSYEGFKTK